MFTRQRGKTGCYHQWETDCTLIYNTFAPCEPIATSAYQGEGGGGCYVTSPKFLTTTVVRQHVNKRATLDIHTVDFALSRPISHVHLSYIRSLNCLKKK